MKDRTVSKFVLRKILPLAALAMVITIAFWVGIVIAPPFQTPSAQITIRPADTPKWEAVSVKPCPPNIRSGAPVLSPGSISECNSVFAFINFAYVFFANGRINPLPVPGTSVEGGPSWIRSDRFVITAKAEGTPSSAMMRGPMLQAILEDRFNLRIHLENREVPVYVLTAARGGVKLQPFKEGGCMPSPRDVPVPLPPPAPVEKPCQHFGFGRGGRYKIDAQGINMEEFSTVFLSSSLGRPVIDKTGIMGLFDFHFEWAVPSLTADPAAIPDATLPSVFTVIEQLGLKLESSRGPVHVFVIDSVQKPSEN